MSFLSMPVTCHGGYSSWPLSNPPNSMTSHVRVAKGLRKKADVNLGMWSWTRTFNDIRQQWIREYGTLWSRQLIYLGQKQMR